MIRGREDQHLHTRLAYSLGALGILLVTGIMGYRILEEEYTLLDAFHMTVITLSTVGFSEVHELSKGGRLFTDFLIVGGIGTVAYTGFVAAETLVDSGVQRVLGRRKRQKKLHHLKNHVIVCGYGRVGRAVCEEFAKRSFPFVVVETSAEPEDVPHDYLMVTGDATEDRILEQARIKEARAVVCTLSNEADTVFLTLSARQLNPDLFIVARADSPQLERKLRRAGANRVICPYLVGARRMAVTTLQPAVFEFMNLLTEGGSSELRVEELLVVPDSPLIGVTLRETGFRERFGVSVVGLKHPGSPSLLTPPPGEAIQRGDILVLIGPEEGLQNLTDWAAGAPKG